MNCEPSERSSLIDHLPLACSPPRLPAATRAQKFVDRMLPTGVWQWPYFVAVALAISLAPNLPRVPGLAVDLVATIAASAWCLLNFWRCREAHCIVTGAGWAALAVLEAVEIPLGRSFVWGSEGLIFVAILIVGVVFEVVWSVRHGSKALVRSQ